MAIIPPDDAPAPAPPATPDAMEPPYGILRGYFKRGEIVPFLGTFVRTKPPAASAN